MSAVYPILELSKSEQVKVSLIDAVNFFKTHLLDQCSIGGDELRLSIDYANIALIKAFAAIDKADKK